jgi:hypothetical protein
MSGWLSKEAVQLFIKVVGTAGLTGADLMISGARRNQKTLPPATPYDVCKALQRLSDDLNSEIKQCEQEVLSGIRPLSFNCASATAIKLNMLKIGCDMQKSGKWPPAHPEPPSNFK